MVEARIELVNKIALLESVETHLDVIQVQFMERVIGDFEGVGDLIFGAGDETSGMMDTNMMAKAMAGVEGSRVEWGG